MVERQFQYEVQPYQEECIHNIIGIFDALQLNQPFCEVMTGRQVMLKYHFPVHDTKNIDIMMETGTGKTFAFIKTMFELNRNFGYRKFIILIPTVPIREGTKTHLEDTKAYFKQYYANEHEKEIEVFVYESGQISSVKRFIGTDRLSALVMTPSSFDKDKNILNRPLENEMYAPNLFTHTTEPPKSYLDCLKRLNPIIIIDEPHRFDGDAFKRYFEGFSNYYLRFGATFPKKKNNNDTTIPLSNVAYSLDSISSFRQHLVKRIVVYTQDIVQNKDSLVKIEKEGSRYKATVNTLTNGIIVQRTLGVGDIYNGKSIRKINANNLILNDESIEKTDYNLSESALRMMIRETIKIHFEKEKMLFELGIKALTLFFIESDTSLYRGENPKIKTIFEEEYKRERQTVIAGLTSNLPLPSVTADCIDNPPHPPVITGLTRNPLDESYFNYLQNDFDSNCNLLVNEGYFSGDKGNADEKIKAGVDEILKNKKKLLSFESPTRFIFSIWALQEGWDNPNVFTICKLSNQGSEISKLQQIGRGLRICVDQNLKRRTIKEFEDNQDDFWKINNLDVVVSNQELGFVEAIQNEILSNSFIVPDTFTKQDLIKTLKEKTAYTENEIMRLVNTIVIDKQMVVFKGLTENHLEIYEKSPAYTAILNAQNLPDEQHKALENLFASDYKNFVQEKRKIVPKKNVVINERHLAEFQSLWNAVNRNAFFVFDNLDHDSEQMLIANIKSQIESLNIDEILLLTVRKQLNINQIGGEGAITPELKDAVSYKSKVDYLQFIHNLANVNKENKPQLPISFIVKIFNALSSDFKNKMLANNPVQALKEMSDIIHNSLINVIKTRIHYEGMDGSISPNVFISEDNETFLKAGSTGKYQKDIKSNFPLREKWIFKDVVEYDSNFEVEIIEQDPDTDEIEIFGKLPKLKIKTPLGEYNPDFCYAIKPVLHSDNPQRHSDESQNPLNMKQRNNEKDTTLILIVESKGYETSTAIPSKGKGKIEFAKKYFDYLNENYKNKNVHISFKERINRTQLASLIKQTIEKGGT